MSIALHIRTYTVQRVYRNLYITSVEAYLLLSALHRSSINKATQTFDDTEKTSGQAGAPLFFPEKPPTQK